MSTRFATVAGALLLPLAGCAEVRAPEPVPERPPEVLADNFRNFEARLLDAHNRVRAAAGMPPLAWDAGLAADAARYGPQLAALDKLVHAPAAERRGAGETLWMGTSGRFSLENMVADWASEQRYFRPGTFPDVSSTGKWADVAHYTQIIWRNTQRVGCAFHPTPKWDYLICRYSPAGNVIGQRVP
ncbi:MAG TPA: CAP domain-containing protein [Allosphingosinicella sp.]|jgi:hypothetical protein